MARVRKQVAAINVVPLIDVMLVLLVVFMITAPFINPGQVELPSVSKTSTTPTLPLEVMIKESGQILLRDRAVAGTKIPETLVTRESLSAEVKKVLRSHPDQPVVIAADKNVRYEEVMHAMSVLQAAQVSRIGLLAKPAE
jgi:biopolymer transport protein TolR